MKKKWIKCYLFLGSLLMVVLSLICSLGFEKNNVNSLENKRIFESIYTETTIDFIVPSPSFAQIDELETSNNGIKTVTPFYETSTSATINGKKVAGNTIIFPDVTKIEKTPYCSTRIISGEKSLKMSFAIVDKIFAKKNGCKIGDNVKITIGDFEMSFTVSSISETNTYYESGTIALLLTEEDASKLIEKNIKFSAAYVEASDLSICENYLKNDYKPFGRLKEKTEFASEEAYNQHLTNFNNADWSKEITNCNKNYETLSVKYSNVESAAMRNLIIASVLAFLTFAIYNIVLIKNAGLNKLMRESLIKKGISKKQISMFYYSGIALNLIEFTVLSFVFYGAIASSIGIKVATYIIHAVGPILSGLISSAIMILVVAVCVKKNFSAKKEKK